ncbi:ThuA domain-containing protein [Candidatus Latescibacterota bacterium]
MIKSGNISRRTAFRTGLSLFAGTTFASHTVLAGMPNDPKYRKQKGETKVVYLGGDQLHNGMQQEQTFRELCNRAGWRLIYTQDARYVTPELLNDADLFCLTRWQGGIWGWREGPLYDEGPRSDGFMSDELEGAIIDNVSNRGMGFMSLHCTIATYDKPKFHEFLGIKGMMHGPVQIVHMHNFNQNHPITKGLEDFDLAEDENFGVELINPNAVALYESTGIDDKRHDIAGWCLDQGKGRIVGLAAGHSSTAWRDPNYRQLYWRGAHWAMKKEMPTRNF